MMELFNNICGTIDSHEEVNIIRIMRSSLFIIKSR